MKAMILAAGRGTRLKPLTDHCPKALISIAEKPLLLHVLEKLKDAGVRDVIINVHHHAEMIIDYLQNNNQTGLNIEISKEDKLLDTGGGLKKAAWFFAKDDKPFYLHNVDILSGIDLREMMQIHIRQKNIATLAVNRRKTSRFLLFDADNSLVGWQSLSPRATEIARESEGKREAYAFLGVHVLSPEIFTYLPDENNFSIIRAYLTIAGKFNSIRAYTCQDNFWFDVGKKENLKQAEKFYKNLNPLRKRKNNE